MSNMAVRNYKMAIFSKLIGKYTKMQEFINRTAQVQTTCILFV